MSAPVPSVLPRDKISQIDLETQVLREQLKERYHAVIQHLPLDDPIRLQLIEEGDSKLMELSQQRVVEVLKEKCKEKLEENEKLKLEELMDMDTPVYRNIKKLREIMMLTKPEMKEWRVTFILVDAPGTWNGDMSVGVGITNGDDHHDRMIDVFQGLPAFVGRPREVVAMTVSNLSGFMVWFTDGFKIFSY